MGRGWWGFEWLTLLLVEEVSVGLHLGFATLYVDSKLFRNATCSKGSVKMSASLKTIVVFLVGVCV